MDIPLEKNSTEEIRLSYRKVESALNSERARLYQDFSNLSKIKTAEIVRNKIESTLENDTNPKNEKDKEESKANKSLNKSEDNLSCSSSTDDPKRSYAQLTTSCFDKFMLISLLFVNPAIVFLRGNSRIESLVKNERCTLSDGIILLGYLVVLVVAVIFNASRFKKYNKAI